MIKLFQVIFYLAEEAYDFILPVIKFLFITVLIILSIFIILSLDARGLLILIGIVLIMKD